MKTSIAIIILILITALSACSRDPEDNRPYVAPTTCYNGIEYFLLNTYGRGNQIGAAVIDKKTHLPKDCQ